MGYIAEQSHTDVVTLRMTTESGWRQRFLLVSDVHFDSPHCDRKLFRRYLDQAATDGAGIMVFGDLFDAMQGRGDKRGDKSDLLPQYKAGDYVNRLVDDAATFLAPYAPHIVMLADGNHETALRKYLEVDILLLLAGRLGVRKMGYAGFVRFMFHREAHNGTRGGRTSRLLWFNHGTGGGGEVTKGVMRAQRDAAWVVADIYVGGHVHEKWSVWGERLGCSNAGEPETMPMLHLCLPTFKAEPVTGGGYHVEKRRPPKPQGAYWLEFRYDRDMFGGVSFDAFTTA